MRACPDCATELEEIFTASAPRANRKLLPESELRYACPACDREWRRRDADGVMVPFSEADPST